MNQREAVIEVMKTNGGYATLGQLYAEVWKIPNVEWKTKTPFASIRRIVQDERFFFKIRPGLWALKDYKHRIPFDELIGKRASQKNQSKFNHSYYQGLLVEIGNLEGFQTTVPNQDKNKKFLETPLSQLVTVKSFYPFTFDHILRRARTVDVVWFNERKMPNNFFEIEHSTDIQNSLLKFLELQDFIASFRIVADIKRKKEYQTKISNPAFKPIIGRLKFIDYETVSKWHSNKIENSLLQQQL